MFIWHLEPWIDSEQSMQAAPLAHDPVRQLALQSGPQCRQDELESGQHSEQQNAQQSVQQSVQQSGQQSGQQNGQLVADLCKIIEQQSVRIHQLVETALTQKPNRIGGGSNDDLGTAKDAEVSRVLAAAAMVAPIQEAEVKRDLEDHEAVRVRSRLRARGHRHCATSRRHDVNILAVPLLLQATSYTHHRTTADAEEDPGNGHEFLSGLDVSARHLYNKATTVALCATGVR